MHTLLFVEPGHFHAALTLRTRHPRVTDDIVVYASDGPDLRDFLRLVERFNGRADDPTSWHVTVVTAADPLARLITERRGDIVIIAGRNRGKARVMRRVHDAGFHALVDKPWLVAPDDLDDITASLGGWPIAMEIMTGRHDVIARLARRLVDDAAVFGAFRRDGPGIEIESVHHLEKTVDGAPLRRPAWYFDVRIQGSGVVDTTTHLVDQTQWWVGAGGAEALRLLSVRAWPTRVPLDAFARITGQPAFPPELRSLVDGDALRYDCNAELEYAVGGTTARVSARWDVSAQPGGGDAYRAVVHGTLSTVRIEQTPATGHRRRLVVGIARHADRVLAALGDAIEAAQDEVPGARIEPRGDGCVEVVVPPRLSTGHESHFALVLDALVGLIDDATHPAGLAARTRAKYALLAEAAARAPVEAVA